MEQWVHELVDSQWRTTLSFMTAPCCLVSLSAVQLHESSGGEGQFVAELLLKHCVQLQREFLCSQHFVNISQRKIDSDAFLPDDG